MPGVNLPLDRSRVHGLGMLPSRAMLTADFNFELPQHLIAQVPLPHRRDSRLLVCDAFNQYYRDHHFCDFIELPVAGDLLVFNDTRVIPARLHGEKRHTGGKIELLVERIVDSDCALCHISASKSPRPGTELLLANTIEAVVKERCGEFFLIKLQTYGDFLTLLDSHGVMPLPPYIERPPYPVDLSRYQTVYASVPGAVAAPTAGLHFDGDMLAALREKGVETAFVTLHVGAGTFQPVRVTDPRQHKMHTERIKVDAEVCEKISATRARGGKVIAVGTTVVRSLEAATRSGVTEPMSGETEIFIRPGYRFRCVDSVLTNFHLSESTLLMLVCAFGGYDFILRAYRHAVQQGYRFFSYGDAMFIHSGSAPD